VADDREVRVVSEWDDQLVDHKSEDTHHSGTAVVELDGTLLELGLLVKAIPAEVDVAVTEVTNELVAGTWDGLHERALEDANERNDLHNTGSGDVVRAEDGGDTVGVGVEAVSSVVDVACQREETRERVSSCLPLSSFVPDSRRFALT